LSVLLRGGGEREALERLLEDDVSESLSLSESDESLSELVSLSDELSESLAAAAN